MTEQGLTPLLTTELNSAIDELARIADERDALAQLVREMAALLEEHLPPFLLHSKPFLALQARRLALAGEEQTST